MEIAVCPIWGTPAKTVGKGVDSVVYDSPRAGGIVSFSDSAVAVLRNENKFDQVAITEWVAKNRGMTPLVTTEVIQSAEFPRLTVSEKRDRVLGWFEAQTTTIGKWINIRFMPNDFVINPHLNGLALEVGSGAQNLLLLSAFAACQNLEETRTLIEFCCKDELLEGQNGHPISGSPSFRLTFGGLRKFEDLRENSVHRNQAFVAMWFSDEMTKVYDEGIAVGIKDAGYDPVVINRKEHNNSITDEIVAEIRRSRFVVADFTSEVVVRKAKDGTEYKDTHARGGVYFEAGFAKGLGKEVIWCVREDLMKSHLVHFDTRQYSHIVWVNHADLAKQLSNRISATIGDGPSKRES